MANPQAENGHIDIANELGEAFQKLQLSGYQWRILWVIFRQTYGWHRKMHQISLSTFEKCTNIPQKKLVPALKDLVCRKVIVKDPTGYTASYGLQKDWESWKNPSPNGESPQGESLRREINPSPKREGNSSPNGETYKEKKKVKKDMRDPSNPTFKEFYATYPRKKARRAAERAWANLNPAPELVQTILSALEKQKRSEDWGKENGRFIPYPATWLNGRRWEDELQEVKLSKWHS